jgi:hypothetical protein
MARYNTVSATTTTTTTSTFATPSQGLLTTLTGTAPYTVTLASPVSFIGIPQTFFNNTGGTVTLASPSGNVKGPGFTAASSQTIPNQATYTLTSDGTDYVIVNNEGGPQVMQAVTASGLITAAGGISTTATGVNVTLSPAGSGTVSIAPATLGAMDNVRIGNSTASDGTFNTITVNTTLTGNGTINGGTF